VGQHTVALARRVIASRAHLNDLLATDAHPASISLARLDLEEVQREATRLMSA